MRTVATCRKVTSVKHCPLTPISAACVLLHRSLSHPRLLLGLTDTESDLSHPRRSCGLTDQCGDHRTEPTPATRVPRAVRPGLFSRPSWPKIAQIGIGIDRHCRRCGGNAHRLTMRAPSRAASRSVYSDRKTASVGKTDAPGSVRFVDGRHLPQAGSGRHSAGGRSEAGAAHKFPIWGDTGRYPLPSRPNAVIFLTVTHLRSEDRIKAATVLDFFVRSVTYYRQS